MPPLNPKEVLGQFRNFWSQLSFKKKLGFIAGLVGLALLITGLVWFLGRPSYGLLYRGLDETTAGQIVQYLREQKIPYKIRDGGIYVLEAKVPEIRMEIASKGLLGGPGPGFELFDKDKLGLTEFQEKVNYQRALEGELSRTILGIKGVKSVRVHLALPKESLFIEEEKPAKASVLIELKPGYSLTQEQAKGIVNLVSGAVPKLDPQNVVIIDSATGKKISPYAEEEGDLVAVTQLKYKKKIEEDLKNKVEEILNSVVGPGKAQAQVSVEVSLDKESISEEKYDPEGSIVSEDLEEETQQSKTPSEGEVAGVKGALVQKFEATSSPETLGETYNRKRVIRNYELSKKVRMLEIFPGSIKRISVAVVVDKKVLSENDTAKIEWIENLVKGAIGYNPERGDEVKVESKTFAEPPVKKPEIGDYMVQFYKPLILIILLILIYFLIIRPLLKALKPAPVPTPVAVGEVPEIVKEEIEEEVLPREIALGIIKSQPERAAALVKKWLLEETLEERKKALAEAK